MPASEPTFENLDNADAVIARGRADGLSEPRLCDAMAVLQPIFDSLGFGEYPPFDSLDRTRLTSLEPEISYIGRALTRSGNADIKGAGYHVLGRLDSEQDLPTLRKGVESRAQWERLEAIRALASMRQPGARTLLVEASHHDDLQTRQAALRALRQS